MDDAVFVGCEKLTLKTWHTPNLESVGVSCFVSCKTLVLSNWDCPTLTQIGECAFRGCKKLTLEEWNAPALAWIGIEAFQGCTALVWKDGCPFRRNIVIDDGAFGGCTRLSDKAKSEIEAMNPKALTCDPW